MLDDVSQNDNPGYSFLGRMYALAQISGIMAAVKEFENG
jgi:mannonate dehydratase